MLTEYAICIVERVHLQIIQLWLLTYQVVIYRLGYDVLADRVGSLVG